jgi:GNAT superfamily N-acetyltransferase
MGLRIDAATSDDVASILALVRELAEFEQLAHEVVATEAQVAASLFGSRRVAECALARVDDALAGFALWFHSYSTFLGRPGIYLEDLYVRPQYRGHGTGRALFRHVAGLALAGGGGRMEWSVLDWNSRAIAFYESLGAQPLRGWTVYRLTGDALQRAGHGGRAEEDQGRSPGRGRASPTGDRG